MPTLLSADLFCCNIALIQTTIPTSLLKVPGENDKALMAKPYCPPCPNPKYTKKAVSDPKK